MGEISRGDVSVLEHASLVWSKALVLVAPHLEEAPFADVYGDVVMGGTTPSIGLIEPICNEPLDLTPLHPLYFPPPPLICMLIMTLGDIKGYNPSFDPYCAYLKDVPRNIM